MKTRKFGLTLGIALVVTSAAGCKKEEAPAAAEGTPAAAEEAKPAVSPEAEAQEIFKGRCVSCHGAAGKGDGPGAAALKVKPRNYTDTAWQTAVTDADLEKVIVKGGAAVGKDPSMPPNPDLKKKPEVVAGIIKIIRAFKGQ